MILIVDRKIYFYLWNIFFRKSYLLSRHPVNEVVILLWIVVALYARFWIWKRKHIHITFAYMKQFVDLNFFNRHSLLRKSLAEKAWRSPSRWWSATNWPRPLPVRQGWNLPPNLPRKTGFVTNSILPILPTRCATNSILQTRCATGWPKPCRFPRKIEKLQSTNSATVLTTTAQSPRKLVNDVNLHPMMLLLLHRCRSEWKTTLTTTTTTTLTT